MTETPRDSAIQQLQALSESVADKPASAIEGLLSVYVCSSTDDESESDDDVPLFVLPVNSHIPTNAAKPALIYPSQPRQAWLETSADEALSANQG